jgi:hypothetical protein
MFGLIFRPERMDPADPDLVASSRAAFEQVATLAAAAQADGLAPGVPTYQLAAVIWASVHGLAQLSLQGVLGGPDHAEDIDATLALMMSLLLDTPARTTRRSRRIAR